MADLYNKAGDIAEKIKGPWQFAALAITLLHISVYFIDLSPVAKFTLLLLSLIAVVLILIIILRRFIPSESKKSFGNIESNFEKKLKTRAENFQTGILTETNAEQVFESFYKNAYEKDANTFIVHLCGGNLFQAFMPMSFKFNHSNPADSFTVNKIIAEIESLDLKGHLFQFFRQLPSHKKLKLNVVLLSPFNNQQIEGIERHRKHYREKNPGMLILEKIYSTLYLLEKIRLNDRIESIDVRLLKSPLPLNLNLINDSIFINNYLVGMRAKDSPYMIIEKGSHEFFKIYSSHIKGLFVEGFDAIRIDFERINYNQDFYNRLTHQDIKMPYEQFKLSISNYINDEEKLPLAPEKKNPFETQQKLLSNYYTKTEKITSPSKSTEDIFPIQMEINLNDYCNHACSWCISENTHKENNKLIINEEFKKFLKAFKKKGGKCITWAGGGEPTIHLDFSRAVEIAAKIGLKQGLLTNGDYNDLLNPIIEKHIEWVRFSVDTHDPKAYKENRGANDQSFNRVCMNIRALSNSPMKRVMVGLNANLANWNMEGIEDLYLFANDLKADYLQIRPVLPTPFEHKNNVRILDEKSIGNIYKEIKKLQNALKYSNDITMIKTKLIVSYDKFEDIKTWNRNGNSFNNIITYQGCASHRILVVLNSDGNLYACMYHLNDEDFCLGNIYENSFENIWKGTKRLNVIKYCQTLDHESNGCQLCCKGHEINKVLLGSIPQKIAQNANGSFL